MLGNGGGGFRDGLGKCLKIIKNEIAKYSNGSHKESHNGVWFVATTSVFWKHTFFYRTYVLLPCRSG